MPSASNTSNSSNIRSNNFNYSISQEIGSRLVVSLTENFFPGLTAGDVIRYDALVSGYTRASAYEAESSEVFGVVESYDSDSNSLYVVTYGSINISENSLLNTSTTPNYGGNDVYFLSDTIPGKLQNYPPTNLGRVVKPIYQIAPNGDNFTGTIVNYIGYIITQ